MAEWSQLPKDLLDLVAKHLNTSFDLLRFRSVCSTWRSSVVLNPHPSPSHFPVLVNDGLFETFWNFKLYKRTIFRLGLSPPNIQTPPHSSSSSHDEGWLIKIEQGQTTHLLNPLARESIKTLPKSFPRRLDLLKYRVSELGHEYILQYAGCRTNFISDAGGSYLEKVALCSRPCLGSGIDSYVFLTIHVSGKLAFFKFGEKKWTIVDDFPSPYDDVILFEEQFYAVDNTGRIVLVNVDESSPVVKLIAPSVFGGDKKALVESVGELLLVDAYLSIRPDNDLGFDEGLDFYEDLDCYMIETLVRFKVFRLDRSEQKWVEVDSLGDKMLFLGDHCTFSAFASDFCGCKGNCIIFTDHFFYSIKDQDDGMKGHIRVFDLESGIIGSLGNYPDYWKMFWPPPPWVSSTMLEVGLDELSI